MIRYSAPPESASRRRGGAALASLFWLLGILLMLVPFLNERSGTVLFGEDFSRSEDDIPFEEDLTIVEEELGIELAGPIREASAAHFGLDSMAFLTSGLVDFARLPAGEESYLLNCAGCHGESGDGAGPSARFMDPRPRNFRKGVFKFTSTATGGKPLRDDLMKTIRDGLAGSAMPRFFLVAEEHRRDLVEYVCYLSMRGEFETLMLDASYDEEELADAEEMAQIIYGRWSAAEAKPTLPTSAESVADAASIERGHEIFMDESSAACFRCHGETGKGDGPSATEFQDDWGYPIVPRDFTPGVFRAGDTNIDLWRSIATGINGTPMGQFSGSLTSDEIWDLVHYVNSLTVRGN